MINDKIISKYQEYGFAKLAGRMIFWGYRYLLIGIRKYGAYIVWPLIVSIFGRKKINLKNQTLRLFFHPYNITWNNERMIEVPWILSEIKKGGRYLEIGNVLNHYVKDGHPVIDLYEKGRGVINQDVVSITGLDAQFDKVVSISTLEHVGWDTAEAKDPGKLKRGIESIMRCLKPGGSLIFTVPLGYNEFLDKSVREGIFTNCIFFKRTGYFSWEETSLDDALKCKYGEPFNAANCLAIITMNKL